MRNGRDRFIDHLDALSGIHRRGECLRDNGGDRFPDISHR
jgi:hypothetical protein